MQSVHLFAIFSTHTKESNTNDQHFYFLFCVACFQQNLHSHSVVFVLFFSFFFSKFWMLLSLSLEKSVVISHIIISISISHSRLRSRVQCQFLWHSFFSCCSCIYLCIYTVFCHNSTWWKQQQQQNIVFIWPHFMRLCICVRLFVVVQVAFIFHFRCFIDACAYVCTFF